MAKRKTSKHKKQSPLTVNPISGRPITADSIFAESVQHVQQKMGKKGYLVGHDAALLLMPVPSLLMRWLLQNEGWPLSGFYQVVGPEGCYKSTLAMEILRWHRMIGGVCLLLEAETKPTPMLRNAVLNYDLPAVHIEDCRTLNEWVDKWKAQTKDFQERCIKADVARMIPYCSVTDSVTGKAARQTKEKFMKEGVSLQFPIEANLLNQFMMVAPDMLLEWPFTWIGVNHLKLKYDEMGNPDYNIPGGWALKFQMTATIALGVYGGIKEFAHHKEAMIEMKTLKNSHGPKMIRANVKFKTWRQNDDGVDRLHARFEWWEGAINLLKFGAGMNKATSARLLPKIKEVCDIQQKSGSKPARYHCKQLDVAPSDAMLAHDLGWRLEQCPEVLAAIYPILGIQRHPYWQPGVDYLSQIDGYKHVARQAQLAKEVAARAAKLQQEALALGATPNDVPAGAEEAR